MSLINSNRFGPALPPSFDQLKSSVPHTRDSWMEQSDSFSISELTNRDVKQAKKKEKTPEYDYSAPGLHIMKKSSSKNKRLFADKKDSSSKCETKKQLDELKARYKKSRDSSSNNDHDSHSSRDRTHSHFRVPNDQRHSTNESRRSRPERSQKSPSSERDRERHHRRSRSNSPRVKETARRRSFSPKERSPRKTPKQRDRSRSPKFSKIQEVCDKKEDGKVNTPSTDKSSNLETSTEKVVTSDDLNKLSAKILKAEITGNANKVTKLSKKLEDLKEHMKRQSQSSSTREETVILTKTDSKGNIRPVENEILQNVDRSKKRRKEKIVNTHDGSGERDKYFPDDKKKHLSDLLQEEKSINKLGHDQLFMKYAGKLSKMSSDRQNWTIDDMFESNIAKEKSSGSKDADRIKSQGQKEHKRLESCQMCLEKCCKDSIIHIGKTLYIRVPLNKSITSYQCHIVPVDHMIASVNGDEDFWDELQTVKSLLTKKFASKKLDTVFLESAQRLGQRRHIFIDCVQVPIEDGALLPAFFKKAILESDVEWAQNKKLVDTRKKSLRKSVPQGLPYFSVEFGTDGGFAHVIEEERLFKRNFGLEVLGGVIDCDVNLWRNPEKETSEGTKYKKRKFEKLSIEF